MINASAVRKEAEKNRKEITRFMQDWKFLESVINQAIKGNAMETKKFVSTVLPDGHLSLPEDTAKEIGKTYDVILIPRDNTNVYTYAETLAKKNKLTPLTEIEIERIIHESRGIR